MWQGEEAHLFVGVTLRPPPRSVERHTSLLVRRSILPGSAEEAAEAAGSSGDWQPADSILEVEPSPASTTSTPGAAFFMSPAVLSPSKTLLHASVIYSARSVLMK